MEKKFTIKKVNPLGDKDPKYGQTFWAEVDEQIQPVMFNLMNGTVQAGDRITTAEVLLKTSGKGTEYHRLKKVTVEQGTNPPQSADLESRVYALEQAVFQGIKDDQIRETAEDVKKEIKLDDEETIDLDSIPF